MNILIVDDELSQRNILADILSDAGYGITTAADGDEALELLSGDNFPVVLTDLKMPGRDGLEVLRAALAYNRDIQVILMTAFGSIPSAVNAIKSGAYDYLTKPFRKEDLLRVVARAVEKASLLMENQALKSSIKQRYAYHNLIGSSAPMQNVYRLIDRIRNIDATVLITGESGTGKELVARAIHYSGKRQEGPFVAINCGAIPENLIESELFGHEKGAFTGALKSHTGKFEQFQGGTIFLDEIGTMPLQLQVRLLRVLQEKKISKVGSNTAMDLDVRVIAATNEDLPDKVNRRQFRTDLYHRLNVFSIHLPPLRERVNDIPLLAKHFIQAFAEQYERAVPRLSPDALALLENYPYPGNVRELENILEKTMILLESDIITTDNLVLPSQTAAANQPVNSGSALPDMEYEWIVNAMKSCRGSIKEAAGKLGITYKTLQYRMKKFGLDKSDFK